MSLADQQWNPTSVQVTVLQARGLRIKGKSGTNDAYAVMQVGKEKFQTTVAEKSVVPVWKEEAAFDLHQGAGGGGGTLHVHVLHRALVGPDKLLGQATINLLQLSEETTHKKTEWFKLLDKAGKPDKERGEVLVDIQFLKNNMTASMFDLSSAGKSRSRLGKFKDKVRGKKKDSDTSSNVVPALTQVMTDSEEEGHGDEEVAAAKDEKKKKLKVKSLFAPKSNLHKSMSQSMSVLPPKNSTLSRSQSGLSTESSEGKKKFKFKIHKRTGSSDNKDSAQKHATAEQSNVCINGSHVYCEEPQPRTSRIGSNYSLASSGHGSMEDVPDSSPPSVDSLRAVRQYSPWTEEEEEEEATKEEGSDLKKEEEENMRMEEERRKKEEEELERLVELKRRQDEEERRRIDEERERREEEERIKVEEEEERVRREVEEIKRLAEENGRDEELKRRHEEERMKKEEEERKCREEEERQRLEERLKREEEERERLAEEKRRLQEQERREREEEERRKMEEERQKREVEERLKLDEERALEEKRRSEEEERARRLAAELKLEEERKKVEEERRRIEEERAREEEEERKREEEEKARRLEEEQKLEEEKRKLAEERRRIEEERAREEEEERKREEEERARKLEEELRVEEEKRKLEVEKRRIEEQRAREEEEERIRMLEEQRKEEEEMLRRQEEERRRQKEKEEERTRQEEEERRRREEEEEERRRQEEEERWQLEEQERKQREEEERMRIAEEKARQLREEYQRLLEENRKLQEEENQRVEAEKKKKKEEEERKRLEEEQRMLEEKRKQEEEERRMEEKRKREEEERIRKDEEKRKEEEERARKEKEEYERIMEEEERRRIQEEEEKVRLRIEEEKKKKEEEERAMKEKEEIRRLEEMRNTEEEKRLKEEEEERIKKEKEEEEARRLEKEKLTKDEEQKKEDKTKKAAGRRVEFAIPAEVTSTNPFDEHYSLNPFEEISSSPAEPNRSRSSTNEKDLAGSLREKRAAPQPPGKAPTDRHTQKEQDGSATRHVVQNNKQSKDAKSSSLIPKRSVKKTSPMKSPAPGIDNAQSSTQNSSTRVTASVAKPGKRLAPSRPVGSEIKPSKASPANTAEVKQEAAVRSLNPFDDDEDEIELPVQEDQTVSGHLGSTQCPAPVPQAADGEVASQTKTKSSKMVHAPLAPANKEATLSILSDKSVEGSPVKDKTSSRVLDVSDTHEPVSEAESVAHAKTPAQQESQHATVQDIAEDAGGKKEAPPAPPRRLQPVKPLNPLEQKPVSAANMKKENKCTAILSEVQEKTKVNDTELKGPYSQLTRQELISMVLKQETLLSQRDDKIAELEKYIDNLLVRVIEEAPTILMSMTALKKAA